MYVCMYVCMYVTPLWHKGGGGDGIPPWVFDLFQYFETILSSVENLYKMRYILWVVALLEVCEVTKHGRRLGFYRELEIS